MRLLCMEKDNEIDRLLENIRLNGCLNLNLDKSPKQCRELWTRLTRLHNWGDVYATKVTLLEIPTVGYSNKEEDLFSNLFTLKNLLSCSLTGGRHGKNGEKLKGGIADLPLGQNVFSPNVTSLDLSFNHLKVIPRCFKHLKNLKILMLDFNDIEKLALDFTSSSCVEELYFRNNNIRKIDSDFESLQKLRVLVLSSNALTELPDMFDKMSSLYYLDVSNNKLEQLSKTIFQSSSLKKLSAGHNQLTELSIECIQSFLDVIDVRYNYITDVDAKIEQDSRILLDGNKSKINPVFPPERADYDVEIKELKSDIAEIDLSSSKGFCYILPSGVKIITPNSLSSFVDKIYCNVISKEPTDFKLNPTDQLLSVVLELTPNGSRFSKPLKISLPFQYSRCDGQTREIVMRVTSVSNDRKIACYEDLKSHVKIHGDTDPNDFQGEVTAYVDHFSIFGVVSRLVEDSTVVKEDAAAALFSSVNNINRLHFPRCSVTSPTNVTVKVLAVEQAEVHSIVGSAYCPVSDVLHVTVLPSETIFHCPIVVHLALPTQLIGRPYDEEQLRLIKCAHNSLDWHDITNDVELVFTTVDVSFQVSSFSKFWLVWRNVMGMARKVYQRVITYKVQFIAMQKQALPNIVYAQCIREDLVQERIDLLIDSGYFGKDAYTVVQELMEGDRFRIKVMGDLKLKTYDNDFERKHLEEKVMVKRFHSQYPPEKSGFCKFCVEPMKETLKAVSGYISFYKLVESLCAVPESDQQLVDRRRDREDSDIAQQPMFSVELEHLDDILITVEKSEAPLHLPEGVEHPLQYGELGTGMFKESNLRYIASLIGAEWEEIGHYLDLRTDDLERIKMDHPGQSKQQIFCMLKKWAVLHMHDDDCITEFTNALKDAERTDLAEVVEKIYSEGVENFRSTIKRSKI